MADSAEGVEEDGFDPLTTSPCDIGKTTRRCSFFRSSGKSTYGTALTFVESGSRSQGRFELRIK